MNLVVSLSTSGDWTLSPSNDLTSAALARALECAGQSPGFIIPGAEDEIEDAVVKLKAATMRPMWMDAEDAAVYEDVLIKACEDYPIDVVQQACANWRRVPDHGKWWPTEQDLRAQCEKLFQPRRSLFTKARVLLQDLRVKEADARRANDRSPFPGEAQRKFRDDMRQRFNNERRYQSYFHPSQIDYEGERTILVRTLIAECVLNREGEDILKRLGLTVRYRPEHFARIRQPQFEDNTPEEQAEVTRKMNRLLAAMKNGENIASLRDQGEV